MLPVKGICMEMCPKEETIMWVELNLPTLVINNFRINYYFKVIYL